MLLPLLLGFFVGVLAVVAVEGAVLLLLIDRLRRRKTPSPEPEKKEARSLDGEQSLASSVSKKGIVWVLEPENLPEVSTHGSPAQLPKEQKNKDIVEVFPVKKHARIKNHCLILLDVDGSQSTIELQNCTIAAVSASNLSSQKWAKRYPIRLESNNSLLFNGNKTCYLYLDTSWEKESWCKALRYASCFNKEKLNWYAQLTEEFHHYLASLNAEYPSFLKPSALFDEATDKSNRIDGSSSKVRLFLKKLAKKASKSGVESKISSTSLPNPGERRIYEKSDSSQDSMLTDGLVKFCSEGKSSSTFLQDLGQLTLPEPSHLGDKNLHPIFPNAVFSTKLVNDDGTLCWNLLCSRLFFDAKRSTELNNMIKARIQRALATMRSPSYIGGVTCTGLDLGNLPPYIHKMTVLPMDLNEAWAIEVDVEYSGGIILDVETRLEVSEPGLQEEIINTSFIPNSAGEVASDLLEGIEHYENQLKSSSGLVKQMENRDEVDNADGLKQSKSSWTSNYISRWKAIKQSFADQVSQVPLSLTVRVASLRGILRLHIKPPPSDQLWFGFTSMPEVDLNLESSVGDKKITGAHTALLFSHRFKAAIRETLVLPNCESICIPWMLGEKDDWIPFSAAPFIRINQETMDMAGVDSSSTYQLEARLKCDSSDGSKVGLPTYPHDKVEEVKNVIHVQEQTQESHSDNAPSQRAPHASVSSSQSADTNTGEESRIPLLRPDEIQCSNGRVNSTKTLSSGAMVASEEQATISSEEDVMTKKNGRRARMMDLRKKVGEKLEEKRRHIEEKSRHIVEKMRENSRN